MVVTVGSAPGGPGVRRRGAAPSGPAASPCGRKRATSGRVGAYPQRCAAPQPAESGHSGCGPRSSATASGVCSRTMVRETCAGSRDGVSSETTTMVANATGTRPRGRLGEQGADPAGPRVVDQGEHDRRARTGRRRPASRRSRRRRSAVATRCRAPAAGRTSRRRPRTPARPPARRRRPRRRRRARSGTTTATTAAAWNARTPRKRRPITSWLITPATAMVRPDDVDRNAANAPAAVSAESSSPPTPPTIRAGSSSTTVSVAPVATRSGA